MVVVNKMKYRKKALNRSTLRDIKGSFGRFFAILAITFLGVGFFSGVRITTPVMLHTINELYKSEHFFDYRLVSTLGWEEEDVEAVRAKEHVKYAEGSYQYDVICIGSDGKDNVYKAHSLTENINGLMLKEGRLPEKSDEVLLDNHNRSGYKIGDTIELSATNDEDITDHFTHKKYTVVGFADSILYLNFERGNTALGNGIVTGFMYLTKEGFDEDIYTEIYVKLDSDEVIYSDEYKDMMEDLRPGWEDETELVAMQRYDRIYQEAADEIQDARDTLAEESADGEKELEDAKLELEDAKKELDDVAEEIADGEKELADAASSLSSAKSTLASSKSTLDSSKETLDSSKEQLDTAKETLDSSKEQLDSAKATLDSSKEQLDSAKETLDSSKEQLDTAKATLDESKVTLEANESILTTTAATLEESKQTLDSSKATLDATKAQLDSAKAEIDANEAQISQAETELDYAEAMGLMDEATITAGRSTIQENKAKLEAAKEQYNTGLAAYTAGLAEYEAGKAQYDTAYEQYQTGLTQYNSGKAQYESGKATYETSLAEYETGLATYEENYATYESGLATYEENYATYESGLATYEENYAAYESGMEQYQSGLSQYNSGLATYYSSLADYNEGVAELEEGKEEYEDGLAEYEDGLAEYEDGLEEFNEKVADAQQEIDDAEKELEDLDKPDTFVLERNTNIAYTCFESDSEIVAQVARVFPVFFILVAALVCMTTMTRMVEEQRGQIGTLKALGYSGRDVMRKFTIYAGSAALIGCISGYAVCVFLFPFVIWTAYKMMYINIDLLYVFDWKLALMAVLVSLLCSVGITVISCRYELSETAASLMRPKAPKPGKRIFLEYIPFIWNRMKFLHKVSFRNILRYKRRFFMMIIGISGCTALLLTGFGMKNSVAGFAEAQYENIQIADAEVTFNNGGLKTVPQEIIETLDSDAEEYTFIRTASWNLLTGNTVKGVNLISPLGEMAEGGEKYTEDFDHFFHLEDMSGNKLAPPSSGEVLVSVSISERYNVKKGSVVTLRDEDMNELKLTVAGVFQNHVYNYVIVSPEDLKTDINAAYINFPEGADVYSSQSHLADCEDTVNVSVFNDFKNRLTNMMSSLNYVVLIIILSAAGLAFVVLYNLTNINITERLREIATIKVLGFYPNETAQYVFRENIVLTFLGMLTGLGLGVLLHRFVMAQIIVDMVHFKVYIAPMSYLYSVVLTFLFTFLVNLVMRRKLSAINMAESLKSVE